MKRAFSMKLSILLMSMMGMMSGAVVSPVLPLLSIHFRDLPHIELLARLVTTLPALFIALFSPFVGGLTDRIGRKRLLIPCLVLYAIAGSSGAFFDNLYWILAGRAVLGISVAGIITACTALVGDLFYGAERNRFMGLQGAVIGFGGVLLIMVAGVLADFNRQAPFYVYLLSVPIALLAATALPETIQNDQRNAAGSSVSESPLPNGRIAVVLGTIFLGVVFFYMIPVQVPFLIGRIEGATGAMVGLAVSMCTLASSTTSLFYGVFKRFLSFSGIYALAFALMAGGYTAVSFCSAYSHYLWAIALAGCGLGLFIPTGNLWILAMSPDRLRGRLVGRSSTAFFLGMFFSPILFQPVVNAFSIHEAFRAAGAFMGAMVVFFIVLSKRPDPAEDTFYAMVVPPTAGRR